MTPAPLPPTEPELEDLMSRHLELVTPSAALRERALDRLHTRLDPQPPGWTWAVVLGVVLLGLGLVLFGLRDGEEPEQQPAPPKPPVVETPEHEPKKTQPAAPKKTVDAPPQAIRIPLQGKREQFAADYDYDRLTEILPAALIVVGRIEVDPQSPSEATLLVKKVLRGKVADLVKVQADHTVSACEGVPDFTNPRLRGKDVCLFLDRRGRGWSLRHGAAGLQPLPFHERLPLQDLETLVATTRLPGPRLVALMKTRGPAVLRWLAMQLNSERFGARSPAVQNVLRRRMKALSGDLLRKDVMALLQFFEPKRTFELPATALRALKDHHSTFTRKLGGSLELETGWVYNGYGEHAAFLEGLLHYDRQWVVQQLELVTKRLEGEKQGPQKLRAYERVRKWMRKER